VVECGESEIVIKKRRGPKSDSSCSCIMCFANFTPFLLHLWLYHLGLNWCILYLLQKIDEGVKEKDWKIVEEAYKKVVDEYKNIIKMVQNEME